MISFSKLGNFGRLGNQLFQYAYLRSQAIRIGTGFYCPPWDGDSIFSLNDQGIRLSDQFLPKSYYVQGKQAGFVQSALDVVDGTEIEGFFQSARYYDDFDMVRGWYEFKSYIGASIDGVYSENILKNAVSISLRLDEDYAATREFFPKYSVNYYIRGLALVPDWEYIFVFADRVDLAELFLKDKLDSSKLVFVRNRSPAEQLYLMSRCGKGNVITNSTFAWWGAFLNKSKSAVVVAPNDWCRSGVPNAIDSIIPEGWTAIRGTMPVFDSFNFWRIRHPVETFKRALKKLL